jgi:REP element-mobilizing transposase RayT
MSTGYKINNQYAAHYVTLQVVFWIDLFTRQAYRDIFIESLKYSQQNKNLEIYAYVVMSNHVHLLAKSLSGDLSGTLRDLKKYTSKKFIERITDEPESRREWMLRLFAFAAKRQNKAGDYQVWTHENHAEEIYSNTFIQQKVEYIHQNPVRGGLVQFPQEYVYSSAKNYAGEDGLVDVVKVAMEWKTVR